MQEQDTSVRTLDHNARFHRMCRDIARHVKWAGRKWSDEEWKRLFLGAKFGQAVVPDPFGGDGLIVVNKKRSSRLENSDMEELMGEIEAFGAEHEVPWSHDGMILAQPYVSESGHWYGLDGSPQYTMKGANGIERNTTLRDARKLNLLPSVTTIMGCAAKPGLVNWQIDQAILAALTLPRNEGEPEADWLRRVKQDGKETARKAADRGTEIHGAIEGYYCGKQPSGDMVPFVQGALNALHEHFGPLAWDSEKSFAHPLGYGGKCDLHCKAERIVVDFKGKDFGPDDKITLYDEHPMQGAAYLQGFGIFPGRFANCFVSRTHPGLARVVEAKAEDIERGWRMFQHLLAYWQEANRYAP